MEATRLALALLVGSLVLGMCMSKPVQNEKRMHRRHEDRQYNISCTEGDFVCNSGDCIPPSWECDYVNDCPEDDDEAECEYNNENCTEGDFTCFSGLCIPSDWQCDNLNDCPDGSDELGCSYDSSDSYAFSWDFSSYSYGSSDYCDFQCNSGACIFSSWVCDGITDCDEGEDESICDPYFEQDLLHFCLLSDVVVPTWMACDRIIDCPFGDDEWLGCYGIHDGFGFAKKKRAAPRELPAPLLKIAKKHMKTEKSLTNDQKKVIDIISENQSAMKKSRMAAKKALVLNQMRTDKKSSDESLSFSLDSVSF